MRNNESLLARRYAQAFLSVSRAVFSVPLLPIIKKAVVYFESHRSVNTLLKIPLIEATLKAQALTQLLIVDFHLPEQFKELITLLVEDKRAFLIKEVLQELYALYLEQEGIMVFTITSSAPLDDTEKMVFERFLTQKTGRTMLFNYSIDTALIAGVRLQSDTLLWEYSIAKQLLQVEHSMKEEIG